MKLVNYKLQTQIELLSEEKSKTYFKDYLNNILEDETKPYYQKADYIGLCLNELKNKIDYVNSNIKEFQEHKKRLTESLNIARELVANALINNGIDRLDGNVISSLTISKASSKIKQKIVIKDEKSLLNLGYVKFELDTEALEKDLTSKDKLKELNQFVCIESSNIKTPAKVKINNKKSSINQQADELINIVQNKLIA